MQGRRPALFDLCLLLVLPLVVDSRDWPSSMYISMNRTDTAETWDHMGSLTLHDTSSQIAAKEKAKKEEKEDEDYDDDDDEDDDDESKGDEEDEDVGEDENVWQFQPSGNYTQPWGYGPYQNPYPGMMGNYPGYPPPAQPYQQPLQQPYYHQYPQGHPGHQPVGPGHQFHPGHQAFPGQQFHNQTIHGSAVPLNVNVASFDQHVQGYNVTRLQTDRQINNLTTLQTLSGHFADHSALNNLTKGPLPAQASVDGANHPAGHPQYGAPHAPPYMPPYPGGMMPPPYPGGMMPPPYPGSMIHPPGPNPPYYMYPRPLYARPRTTTTTAAPEIIETFDNYTNLTELIRGIHAEKYDPIKVYICLKALKELEAHDALAVITKNHISPSVVYRSLRRLKVEPLLAYDLLNKWMDTLHRKTDIMKLLEVATERPPSTALTLLGNDDDEDDGMDSDDRDAIKNSESDTDEHWILSKSLEQDIQKTYGNYTYRRMNTTPLRKMSHHNISLVNSSISHSRSYNHNHSIHFTNATYQFVRANNIHNSNSHLTTSSGNLRSLTESTTHCFHEGINRVPDSAHLNLPLNNSMDRPAPTRNFIHTNDNHASNLRYSNQFTATNRSNTHTSNKFFTTKAQSGINSNDEFRTSNNRNAPTIKFNNGNHLSNRVFSTTFTKNNINLHSNQRTQHTSNPFSKFTTNSSPMQHSGNLNGRSVINLNTSRTNCPINKISRSNSLKSVGVNCNGLHTRTVSTSDARRVIKHTPDKIHSSDLQNRSSNIIYERTVISNNNKGIKTTRGNNITKNGNHKLRGNGVTKKARVKITRKDISKNRFFEEMLKEINRNSTEEVSQINTYTGKLTEKQLEAQVQALERQKYKLHRKHKNTFKELQLKIRKLRGQMQDEKKAPEEVVNRFMGSRVVFEEWKKNHPEAYESLLDQYAGQMRIKMSKIEMHTSSKKVSEESSSDKSDSRPKIKEEHYTDDEEDWSDEEQDKGRQREREEIRGRVANAREAKRPNRRRWAEDTEIKSDRFGRDRDRDRDMDRDEREVERRGRGRRDQYGKERKGRADGKRVRGKARHEEYIVDRGKILSKSYTPAKGSLLDGHIESNEQPTSNWHLGGEGNKFKQREYLSEEFRGGKASDEPDSNPGHEMDEEDLPRFREAYKRTKVYVNTGKIVDSDEDKLAAAKAKARIEKKDQRQFRRYGHVRDKETMEKMREFSKMRKRMKKKKMKKERKKKNKRVKKRKTRIM